MYPDDPDEDTVDVDTFVVVFATAVVADDA